MKRTSRISFCRIFTSPEESASSNIDPKQQAADATASGFAKMGGLAMEIDAKEKQQWQC